MLFSEHYCIHGADKELWFDPILNHDTKLFVDPFLIFQSDDPDFSQSHPKLITFFNDCFHIAAQSSGNKNDLRYKQLIRICRLKEATEICLGYASLKGTDGAGSGDGFSTKIVAALFESIKLGIHQLNHFEEIGLFSEGIGCDRISDATVQILKLDFISYTQKVCKAHNIACELFPTLVFNTRFKRWEMQKHLLPKNPCKANRGVILVPKSFLRSLPTLDKDEFWDFCWDIAG